MPTLRKLLSKFNREDRDVLGFLIKKIISLDWRGLNVKKLQGYQDIFRLRRGKLRIIFYRHKVNISIINIERRAEKTYRL